MQLLVEQIQMGGSEEGKDGGGVLSWPMVEHLVGDICYGGRVIEQLDRTALSALLSKYCRTHVSSEHKKVGLLGCFE